MTKKSAAKDAYERIKKALIMRRLLPGQQLTEEWIGRNLNMSRTPIRSALKELEREGLIKMISNRGAFVADPSKKEIKDVYNIRILLECYAMEQALFLYTDKDIEKMEELLDEEKKAYEVRDFEKFININDQIHLMPALLSGNDSLIKHVSSLISFGNCFIILKDNFYINPIDKVKSIPHHELILDSIKRKDKSAAVEAVRKHLQFSVETFIDSDQQALF